MHDSDSQNDELSCLLISAGMYVQAAGSGERTIDYCHPTVSGDKKSKNAICSMTTNVV